MEKNVYIVYLIILHSVGDEIDFLESSLAVPLIENLILVYISIVWFCAQQNVNNDGQLLDIQNIYGPSLGKGGKEQIKSYTL